MNQLIEKYAKDLDTSQKKIQFSSVAQLCPTLCNPMNHSTPGLPVHHQLPEFTQTRVHRVSDAIQPSHPLSYCKMSLYGRHYCCHHFADEFTEAQRSQQLSQVSSTKGASFKPWILTLKHIFSGWHSTAFHFTFNDTSALLIAFSWS